MADHTASTRGRGPEGTQSRRQLLQSGLGLAGTALAFGVIAAVKSAPSAVAAAAPLSDSGKRTTTEAQLSAPPVTHYASQQGPFHSPATQVAPAVRLDGTAARQSTLVPEMADLSSEAVLQWLTQHWQEVVEVGVPVATVATLAMIVRGRVTTAKAMESSFQRALAVGASADIEGKVAAAGELLNLLSAPRSEKYHQRIFAMAVDHFRQRDVANADRRETPADFKFVPVLIFAALALRERLQNKGTIAGDAREAYLNASQIHLDGLSLIDADLSYLVLQRATFNGAVLSSANFAHADLAGADLGNTTGNGIDLSHASLVGASLRGARARKANLRHALLRTTDLGQADLSFANWEGAELSEDATLRGANIYGATGLTGEMRKKCLELGAVERN